jgi:DNA-binding MarR family transcriptional regulator
MGTHINSRGRTDHATLAMDSLRRIVQALRSGAGSAMRKTGLSGAQLFVLQQLQTGPASINQLAARTRTHQSSVSVVVSRLCRRGFARRGPDARDARKVVATITPTGRRLLARVPAMPQALLIGAVSRLSRAQRAQLAHLLARLARAMGQDRTPAPLFFEET